MVKKASEIGPEFVSDFKLICQKHGLDTADPAEVMNLVEKLFVLNVVSFCEVCLAFDEEFDVDEFLTGMLANVEANVVEHIAKGSVRFIRVTMDELKRDKDKV